MVFYEEIIPVNKNRREHHHTKVGDLCMKVGFIGAGKVGCSLGAYFVHQGIQVVGFTSRSETSAKEAGKLTHTQHISNIESLVTICDVLFITVSDDSIASVWEQIKTLPIQGKFICHCSGSLSSTIFSGIESTGAYGYSIHPMFPFQSKTIPYEELSQAVICVEGDTRKLEDVFTLFSCLPNEAIFVKTKEKAKYHGAAVFASNLVVALMEEAIELLEECGFTRENAIKALKPLAMQNLNHIFESGPKEALTGPVERNDMGTVQKHLEVFSKEERDMYLLLSKKLVKIAKEKHKETDYQKMQRLLEEEK
ncbi:MAG: DUF2520 domain-containing protein [Anaerostipes sp.]|nr:DUF2520 domain-containing protein [Anaerostipes sp.]